jgi:hypothetical protein
MIPSPSPIPPHVDLAGRILRRISARTGGQIRGLEVVVTGNRVAICGRASSYYHKQLAIEEIRREAGPAVAIQVDVDIHPLPLPPFGTNDSV